MKREAAMVGGGVAMGALLEFFLDKDRGRRRRKLLVDRARGMANRTIRRAARAERGLVSAGYGVAMKATHRRERPKPQPDDATLARKVETEIFRPADAPKATVNVNAEHGVVYLRGEVSRPEVIEELVEKARKVKGVRDVRSLLHLPQSDMSVQVDQG
jgi:osmotically-inducible protein OsmY